MTWARRTPGSSLKRRIPSIDMNSPTSFPYARRVFGLSTLASHSAAAGTSASCWNSAAEISRGRRRPGPSVRSTPAPGLQGAAQACPCGILLPIMYFINSNDSSNSPESATVPTEPKFDGVDVDTPRSPAPEWAGSEERTPDAFSSSGAHWCPVWWGASTPSLRGVETPVGRFPSGCCRVFNDSRPRHRESRG